jgi:hypothetical protein
MKSLLDILKDPVPFLKILNCAPSGYWKTRMSVTFPDPIWVFDCDDRIYGALDIAIARKKTVEYDTYLPNDPTSFDRLMVRVDELIKLAAQGKFPYKTVVLDTITTACDGAMIRGMPVTKAFYKPSRPVVSIPRGDSVEVPVQADYQTQGVMVSRLIGKLAILPCHVIANAHEYTQYNKAGELLAKLIQAPGQQRTSLPSLFNELWRMTSDPPKADATGKLGESKFWLCTRSDNLHSARTCYPQALGEREEPDFDIFYPKILRWLDAKRKELGITETAPLPIATAAAIEASK